MGSIVAIGGGEISKFSTLLIDREIVRMSKKEDPRVLFIPTASGDEEAYWESFNHTYQNKLNCNTEVLRLIKEQPSFTEIQSKILNSDIIYVGGGDTLRLMAIWNQYDIYSLFIEAFEKGVILSGISAGASCWFKSGVRFNAHDSFNKPIYSKIDGIGIINAFFCPHFNQEERAEQFKRMMMQSNMIGYGIEDNCALAVTDSTVRILISKEEARGFKCSVEDGELIARQFINPI